MALNWLEICGILFISGFTLYIVKSLFSIIYVYYISPKINKVDFRSKGQWALVTGSTDGIGKQYAKNLAARGCDIILVSRSMDKLKQTAEEIGNEYKVKTKIVQLDFGEAGEQAYDNLAKEIADLEIGTLVNNVGVYQNRQFYLDLFEREKAVQNMLQVNILSVTRVTAIVLPGMVKRKKGVVINIGSVAAITPSPMTIVYAASKAFVNKFTEGIYAEYGNKGIIVQSVSPGVVCTKMSGVTKESFLEPSVERYVESAISLVGTSNTTTGYLPHALLVVVLNGLYRISPQFIINLIITVQLKRARSTN